MESRKVYLYVINDRKEIIETKEMNFATGEKGDVYFFSVFKRFFEVKHHLVDYSRLGFTFGMPRYLSWEDISSHVKDLGESYENVLLSILEQWPFFIKDKDKIVNLLNVAESNFKSYQDRLAISSEHVEVSTQNIALIRKTIKELPTENGEFLIISPESADKVLASFKQVSVKSYGPFLKSLMPTKSDDEINGIALRVKGIAENSIQVIHFGVNEYNIPCVIFEPIDCYYANDGRLNELMDVINDHFEDNVGVLRRMLNDIYYDMSIPIPEKKEKMVAFLTRLGVTDCEGLLTKYYRFNVSEDVILKERTKLIEALNVKAHVLAPYAKLSDIFNGVIESELKDAGFSNYRDFMSVYPVEKSNHITFVYWVLREMLYIIYSNENISLNSRRLLMIQEAIYILGSKKKAIELIEAWGKVYPFNIRECDVKKLFKNGNK